MRHDFANLSLNELVVSCVAGESGAWEEFVARTQPMVARTCAHAARLRGQRDASQIDDYVQETYTRLLSGGLLARFEPRHPDAVYGLLKLVATRVVQDQGKARAAAKRGRRAPEVSLEVVEPAAPPFRPEDAILLDQIEASVREVSSGHEVDRDLLIFQLYYRLGLSAAAIASIPSLELTVKGVESFLFRLTTHLRLKMAAAGEREKAAYGAM
jgi:DNA-directed RNA polymerase specialized sigma24 family protein